MKIELRMVLKNWIEMTPKSRLNQSSDYRRAMQLAKKLLLLLEVFEGEETIIRREL